MAIHPDIRDQAYGFFVQEAPEFLQMIETELLQLRRERTRERVHSLMRAAHSIKGGAASVGMEVIKSLAHRLEDCFRALYSDELAIDDDLEALFFQGYDCLRNPLLEAIQLGSEFNGEPALAVAEPIFAQLEMRLGDFMTGEDQLPTVAEMGIDIAQSLFETDVAEGLARLAALTPNDPILAGELRAQSEVFQGLAELLNLPGLAEMAKLTLTALDQQPHRVAELHEVALADYRAAQVAVLEGDRQQGGMPSPALRALAEPETGLAANMTPLATPTPEPLGFGGWDLGAGFGTDAEMLPGFGFATEAGSLDELFAPIVDDIVASAPMLDDVFGAETSHPETAADNIWESAFAKAESGAPADEAAPIDAILGAVAIPDPLLGESFPAELSVAESPWDWAEAEAHQQEPAPVAVSPEFSLNEPNPVADNLNDGLTDDWFAVEELALGDEPTEELAEPAPESISTSEVASDTAPTPLAAALLSIQQNLTQQDLTTLPTLSPAELANLAAPVVAVSEPTPAATVSPETVAKATTANATVAQQLTVRLELERLERMNNQLGELSINRNSLSLQNEQLQAALQELQRRFGNFLDLGTQLRGQVNKMMLSPERYSGRQALAMAGSVASNGNGNGNGNSNGNGKNAAGNPGGSPNRWLSTPGNNSWGNNSWGEFDSLEMDSYSEIYRQLQEAMECILQIEEVVGDVMLFAERSDKELEQQRRNLTALRDELMWARMLPLGNVLDRFPRMLRDLSLRFQKPADLNLSGTGVLVDKAVLDKLADPLTHLIRNAFDHGLESAEERRAAGKPERGQIQIQAYHQGSRTLIEVRDDGRGINLERIRAKAAEMGLLKAAEANTISSSRLLDLMFEPGFSTAEQVSELSGRGVGLDIVRGQLQSLKGSISVSSEPGQGTTFTLRIPLTLSISKLLLVWTGTSIMALPSDAIEDIGNPEVQEIKRTNGQRFWRWRGQMLPIYSLRELLPYHCPVTEMVADIGRSSVPTPESWGAPLLILRQGSQFVALEVERLLNEQELVIKPFSTTLAGPSYLYGSTILGNGSLVPVIDSLALFNQRQSPTQTLVQGAATATLKTYAATTPAPVNAVPTVLVVDDSTMMRQTLTLSLEKVGYRVFQARDGREALDQLQQQTINLVICDIEMPGMNGFEFLTQRRQQQELMHIPVAMLTSRGGEKHRQLARTLGATAYFTKPYIEQQFLVSIRELLANASPVIHSGSIHSGSIHSGAAPEATTETLTPLV